MAGGPAPPSRADGLGWCLLKEETGRGLQAEGGLGRGTWQLDTQAHGGTRRATEPWHAGSVGLWNLQGERFNRVVTSSPCNSPLES